MPIARPAPGVTKGRVVGIVAIAIGCALAIWFGLASTLGKATGQTLGYHVIDDRNVDVTYLVSRPSGRDVTCVLQALDQGFGTVGRLEVDIAGSDSRSVKLTTRVHTTTRAVTGVVKSCAVG